MQCDRPSLDPEKGTATTGTFTNLHRHMEGCGAEHVPRRVAGRPGEVVRGAGRPGEVVRGAELSCNLVVVVPDVQQRSKSPVTVQEWVAALPDTNQHKVEEERPLADAAMDTDSTLDSFTLGAEGSFCSSLKR